MIYKFQWIDLFPYLLLVLLCISLSYLKYRKRDCSTLIFVALFLFSSLRYQTGYDYGNYLETILAQDGEEKFEILVRWLISFSRTTHYQFFFIITSFLTLYPIYRLSKKYSLDPSLSLIVYLLFPIFYLESLSIIRNAVAFSFITYALDEYLERSYVKAILFYILAIGFHTSAILGILLVVIERIKLSRGLLILIYITSFFVSPIILSAVSSIQSDFGLFIKISNYAINGKVGAGATMAILINCIGVLSLVYWKRLEKLGRYNYLWLVYVMFGVIFWNCFGFEGTLRLRISSFFLIYLILLLPSFKYVFKRISHIQMKGILTLFLLVVFMASFYININGHLKDLSKMSFLPYQTVLNRVEYTQYN